MTSTHWLRGLIDFTGVPSARYTSPSHWNPGMFLSNPRSMTASTRCPAYSGGTVPVRRNHVVPQAAPHGVPTAYGE